MVFCVLPLQQMWYHPSLLLFSYIVVLLLPCYAKTTRATTTNRSTSDRKSTRLNSSHSQISYAVFCLKKKKQCLQDVSSEFRTPKVIRIHFYCTANRGLFWAKNVFPEYSQRIHAERARA